MVTCIECIYCKVLTSPENKRYFQCLYSDEDVYEAFSPQEQVSCEHFFLRPQKPFKHELNDITLVEIAFSHKPPFAHRVLNRE